MMMGLSLAATLCGLGWLVAILAVLLWEGLGAPLPGPALDTLVLATHQDYRAQLRQWLGAGSP